MREFAKDSDVIHVTIDRKSLAQLTKLSERDIKRDESVKLVNNSYYKTRSRLASDEPLEDNENIKTIYGTFSKEANIDLQRLTITSSVKPENKKSGGGHTTSEGRLETMS